MKYLMLIISLLSVCVVNALSLESKLIKINGHTLHYNKVGDKGTPLVLLTGYGTTSNFWNNDFIQCLAQSHVVYLFDYQGVGVENNTVDTSLTIKSMAQDVNVLVSKLKLKKPELIGWSMGGGVALEASFLAPRKYNHLYLISTIVPVFDVNSIIESSQKHDKLDTENKIMNFVLSNNIYDYSESNLTKINNDFIESWLNNVLTGSNINTYQGIAMRAWMTNPSTMSAFSKAKVPATFYIPDHDKIIHQNNAENTILKYPKATIIKIKNSGHAISWQYPKMLCSMIVD